LAPSQDSGAAVLAVGAHPDDIEFMMSGTMLALGGRGVSLHMWSITDGSLGSDTAPPRELARVRLEESRASAQRAGAVLHEPVARDLELSCEPGLLKKAVSVIRLVQPRIILVPSPYDYHPDHRAAAEIAVVAAFARGIPAFEADPPRHAWTGETVIYHAMPFGLRDRMRQRRRAGQYVDVAPVMARKREMLSAHASQKEWLRESQGIDSIEMMEQMCRSVGVESGRFDFAEGWCRHLHTGLGAQDSDPLSEFLGNGCLVDAGYEESLQKPL